MSCTHISHMSCFTSCFSKFINFILNFKLNLHFFPTLIIPKTAFIHSNIFFHFPTYIKCYVNMLWVLQFIYLDMFLRLTKMLEFLHSIRKVIHNLCFTYHFCFLFNFNSENIFFTVIFTAESV